MLSVTFATTNTFSNWHGERFCSKQLPPKQLPHSIDIMKKTMATLVGLALLSAPACVGKKKFIAEKNARIATDAREKVLVQELLDRKRETGELTRMVGELNRNVGRQETEIKNLESELNARTQSMGESASKLASENAGLEKQLTQTSEKLEASNAQLARIKAIQEKRQSILAELAAALEKSFGTQPENTLAFAIEQDAVSITIADKVLFEPAGLGIPATGKNLLQILAEFLAARPSLDVDVAAYTDNVLPPKEKTLKDTWDWSLQRATNVVRLMIREFNANANQLTPVAKGEFYPVTSNETPEGRAKNRRTVFLIHPLLPAVPKAE
jgi:chemotaxis protein MotB